MRFSFVLFSLILFVAPFMGTSHAADGAPLTRADVEGIIRDYLIKNPEVLVEAMQVLEKKQAEGQSKQFKTVLSTRGDALFKDKNAPVAGNPEGDVTLVEFFDYQCGYCKHMLPTLIELTQQDKNLRVVFKELPILSKESRLAATYALAVHRAKPDAYFGFHKKLMEYRGMLNKGALEGAVKELGLDPAKIAKDAESEAVQKILAANAELANSLGLRGTPAMVVGSELIPGAADKESLKEKIAAARQKN